MVFNKGDEGRVELGMMSRQKVGGGWYIYPNGVTKKKLIGTRSSTNNVVRFET